MSIGLVALLDDVAGLARLAAASLDDIAGQAARSGVKAAGVVIDDAAVTPNYVSGFTADRELPVIGKITLGSLRNKLLILLPLALALGAFAPWAITPLLMLGGAYLSFEGAEKVFEALIPHSAHEPEAAVEAAPTSASVLEESRVSGAIKTDFILSAEIMAITLASMPEGSVLKSAIVMALVGVGITLAVYGTVALIVKADDVGLVLAKNPSRSPFAVFGRRFGRGLVTGMPVLLNILGIVGTAAMIWVGGGILIHGLETYGAPQIGHAVHDLATAAAHTFPPAAGFVEWLVTAAASGVFGLVLGGLLVPVANRVVAPAMGGMRSLLGRKAKH